MNDEEIKRALLSPVVGHWTDEGDGKGRVSEQATAEVGLPPTVIYTARFEDPRLPDGGVHLAWFDPHSPFLRAMSVSKTSPEKAASVLIMGACAMAMRGQEEREESDGE